MRISEQEMRLKAKNVIHVGRLRTKWLTTKFNSGVLASLVKAVGRKVYGSNPLGVDQIPHFKAPCCQCLLPKTDIRYYLVIKNNKR